MQFKTIFNSIGFASFLALTFLALTLSSISSAAEFEDNIEDSSYLDYQKATALMMDTDISGDPRAQYELALVFHNGSLGYADSDQAKILYTLSAENGYKPAQKYLATAYISGNYGFEKNPQLGKYWNSLFRNNATLY